MTAPTTPLWRAIASTLGDEIAAGQYQPGDKLPTEAALAARFGVNRHTLRHALADLAAQGLVHSRRGAGVFVAVAPTDYALGRRVRFHQNLLASGRTPSRQMLRLETRAADVQEAEALGLVPGEAVHVVEGLSLSDGTPVAIFLSIFPAARFPALLTELAKTNSVTAALAASGLSDYTRASTRLTAVAADTLLARHLRLPQGAPLLRSVASNVDAAGVVIEHGVTWFAGERVTLTILPEDLS
jgi:GntR family transcriptional regulator, phosphonate transport system regulatory protein